MPRKRKVSGGRPIALYALLLVVALSAQIPKQVWIPLGVILGILLTVTAKFSAGSQEREFQTVKVSYLARVKAFQFQHPARSLRVC